MPNDAGILECSPPQEPADVVGYPSTTWSSVECHCPVQHGIPPQHQEVASSAGLVSICALLVSIASPFISLRIHKYNKKRDKNLEKNAASNAKISKRHLQIAEEKHLISVQHHNERLAQELAKETFRVLSEITDNAIRSSNASDIKLAIDSLRNLHKLVDAHSYHLTEEQYKNLSTKAYEINSIIASLRAAIFRKLQNKDHQVLSEKAKLSKAIGSMQEAVMAVQDNARRSSTNYAQSASVDKEDDTPQHSL